MAAALVIQKDGRMLSKRKAYMTLYNAAVVIQTGMRVMYSCNALRFQRRNKAATIIQVLPAPHPHPLHKKDTLCWLMDLC